MRDEFNHYSRRRDSSEYSTPREERLPVEYSIPEEYPQAKEQTNAKEYFESEITVRTVKTKKKDRKKFHKLKLMTYLVSAGTAVIIVTQTSVFTEHTKYTESPTKPAEIVQEPVVIGEWGYDNNVYVKKPELPNQKPNGPVTVSKYGLVNAVLNEEYIFYTQDGVKNALWKGSRINEPAVKEQDNIYYDYDSNTLHLKDCNLDMLEVNFMGNSFTIEVEGVCHIGHILVWGFYYGGSITFTGESGVLYVNEDGQEEFGISLKAENSMSGIFVDKMEGLYIYGSGTAAFINATEMEKPVYWKTTEMKLQDNCDYNCQSGETDGIYNVSLGGEKNGTYSAVFLPVEQKGENSDPVKEENNKEENNKEENNNNSQFIDKPFDFNKWFGNKPNGNIHLTENPLPSDEVIKPDFDLHWDTVDVSGSCVKDGEIIFEFGNMMGKTFYEAVEPLSIKYSEYMNSSYQQDKLGTMLNPNKQQSGYWSNPGQVRDSGITDYRKAGISVYPLRYNDTEIRMRDATCPIVGIRIESHNFSDKSSWDYADEVRFSVGRISFEMTFEEVNNLYNNNLSSNSNEIFWENEDTKMLIRFDQDKVCEIIIWNADIKAIEDYYTIIQ